MPVKCSSPVEACPRLQSPPPSPLSSVLGWHETYPQSLPPLASAALNQSLAPAANDSARDDDELTVTADDGRVDGSVDPPSLRVSSNARRHEVERKTMPVPFIRISEPKPELDNEASLEQKR
ncbi:hypothetical protein K438DRAFT_1767286 [Mycena galopus ATCC 62051]|nr:hypothetical protein K438DRAFT_1767286 [Mycena galopus ATCC 62051]